MPVLRLCSNRPSFFEKHYRDNSSVGVALVLARAREFSTYCSEICMEHTRCDKPKSRNKEVHDVVLASRLKTKRGTCNASDGYPYKDTVCKEETDICIYGYVHAEMQQSACSTTSDILPSQSWSQPSYSLSATVSYLSNTRRQTVQTSTLPLQTSVPRIPLRLHQNALQQILVRLHFQARRRFLRKIPHRQRLQNPNDHSRLLRYLQSPVPHDLASRLRFRRRSRKYVPQSYPSCVLESD